MAELTHCKPYYTLSFRRKVGGGYSLKILENEKFAEFANLSNILGVITIKTRKKPRYSNRVLRCLPLGMRLFGITRSGEEKIILGEKFKLSS